jgi:hypothetical protein
MRYWLVVSFLAWGTLSLIGVYWPALHAWSATTVLFAAGIGCVANWLRNRTLHCAITGPILLTAAVVFPASNMGKIHVNSRLLWPFVVCGTGIAFSLEWRYTKSCPSEP